MKLSQIVLSLCLLAFFHSVSSLMNIQNSFAQEVPPYWPYQDIIFDSNGSSIEGTVTLDVKIYSSEEASLTVWQGSINTLRVQKGTLSIDLGTVGGELLRQTIDRGEAKFIGIAVNGDTETTPRTRIGSIPYATLSNNSLKFNGQTAESFVTQEDLADVNNQLGSITKTVSNAQSVAEESQTIAVGASQTAQIALETANTAQTATEAIQDIADNTVEVGESVTNAQEAANQAQAAATEAQEAADEAQTAVEAAQNTANTAVTEASNAATTASQALIDVGTALSTAQTAQATAETALLLAGPAKILGPSTQGLTGWAQFRSKQGIEAMGELCSAEYANVEGAHAYYGRNT